MLLSFEFYFPENSIFLLETGWIKLCATDVVGNQSHWGCSCSNWMVKLYGSLKVSIKMLLFPFKKAPQLQIIVWKSCNIFNEFMQCEVAMHKQWHYRKWYNPVSLPQIIKSLRVLSQSSFYKGFYFISEWIVIESFGLFYFHSDNWNCRKSSND